ncbi:hypothetical protein CH75_21580 [Dyella jiangningensis]|nr:hypothetical protein CH75_21580 [Dyella jiangningensis]
MRPGRCLFVAIVMLAAGPFASGAEPAPLTPDALAGQVQALLHDRYGDTVVVDRVIGIEQRIGAYRAARSRAALVERLNADLRVATGDARVRLCEGQPPSGMDLETYPLATGLHLVIPAMPH